MNDRYWIPLMATVILGTAQVTSAQTATTPPSTAGNSANIGGEANSPSKQPTTTNQTNANESKSSANPAPSNNDANLPTNQEAGVTNPKEVATPQTDKQDRQRTVRPDSQASGDATSNNADANSRAPRATQNEPNNRWRYRRHNGEWWYWTKGNNWVYWRDDRWNPYQEGKFTPLASDSTDQPMEQATYQDDGVNAVYYGNTGPATRYYGRYQRPAIRGRSFYNNDYMRNGYYGNGYGYGYPYGNAYGRRYGYGYGTPYGAPYYYYNQGGRVGAGIGGAIGGAIGGPQGAYLGRDIGGAIGTRN